MGHAQGPAFEFRGWLTASDVSSMPNMQYHRKTAPNASLGLVDSGFVEASRQFLSLGNVVADNDLLIGQEQFATNH